MLYMETASVETTSTGRRAEIVAGEGLPAPCSLADGRFVVRDGTEAGKRQNPERPPPIQINKEVAIVWRQRRRKGRRWWGWRNEGKRRLKKKK